MKLPFPSGRRRLLELGVLGLCLLLLLRGFVVEVYDIPSGSMAPAFHGAHRTCLCPRCGASVTVGLPPAAAGPAFAAPGAGPGRAAPRFDLVHCPGCGSGGLPLADAPDALGDRILVHQSAFLFRPPRRWQVVVFRLFGQVIIKRVVGLPGEAVEIRDGDLHVNGRLERKTLREFLALPRPVIECDRLSANDALWRSRWQPLAGTELPAAWSAGTVLDGTDGPQGVVYRHYFPEERKCFPITDEYVYNRPRPLPTVPVHDFALECDLCADSGAGAVTLALTDGGDTAVCRIPVGPEAAAGTTASLRAYPVTDAAGWGALLAEPPPDGPGAQAAISFRPGSCYHVTLALVDRRVTLRAAGREIQLDLPPAADRLPVTHPFALSADGVRVRVSGLRLSRDVHYTQDGRNAVDGGTVRLGAKQYFVLGDNSPASDDSRFWPDGGAVPVGSLLGTPVARWER